MGNFFVRLIQGEGGWLTLIVLDRVRTNYGNAYYNLTHGRVFFRIQNIPTGMNGPFLSVDLHLVENVIYFEPFLRHDDVCTVNHNTPYAVCNSYCAVELTYAEFTT